MLIVIRPSDGGQVDDYVLILRAKGLDRLSHDVLTVRLIYELHLCCGQVRSRAYDVQLLELDACLTGGSKIRVPDEDVV